MLKIRNNILFSFKHSADLKKCALLRHASTGVGVWNDNLTTEHKHEIEFYWRDKIHKIDESSNSKDKFYVLSMFPYPSGSLHMGHVRVYTISDSIARFYRMQGKNVIHPMGWDAFGLPAENAAKENKVDPAFWTKENIKAMRQQLADLGCTFDTHREFATCDPEYYRWTQELFIKLFENGLLYQKETFVNWDPVDKTVLADEQIDENGRSWRSGAQVEKKLLKQWFVKTTAFAQSLLEGLKDKTLKEWKDIIKMQEHWIGDCSGTNIEFPIISDEPGYPSSLTLWTDHPEFIEEAKFVAISNNNILSKVERSDSWDPNRKLKATVINPFTNEKLPIFVTEKEKLPYPAFRDDYLGIPRISEANVSFCKSAKIKYESPIIYSAAEIQEKKAEILRIAKERNIGGHLVGSKLRDWLISRQRYWGTPIPIVHCEKCGPQPVPRDQLPVELPTPKTPKKEVSLKNALHWMKTTCPECNGPATRETDTMDTFVDSSWYFMRYIDPKNTEEMFSKELASRYLPVDLYIGGKEHATLHLYYARFISHFLYSLGMLPTREPFKQLLVQGMVMGQSYSTRDGKYLKADQVTTNAAGTLVEKSSKEPVVTAWEKMSKSKYNGVSPSKMFSQYSTDTIRLLILADVAPTSNRNWSEDTFPGILNWQRKLYQMITEFIAERSFLNPEELDAPPIDDPKFQADEALMFDARNYYVHGVTFNIVGSQQLSIAISKMLGLTNDLKRAAKPCIALGREYERALAAQIIMLAPLAPHFASELWAGFCKAPHRLVNDGEFDWDKDVLQQRWPEVDMEYKLKLNVKMNGKEFLKLRVRRRDLETMDGDDILRIVAEEEKFKRYLEGRKVTRVFYNAKRSAGAEIQITAKKNVTAVSQEKIV
ncbi:hypothetical protein TKK_0000704 [Trichogramma kaykai]|uniref:leucine--tRNA ligase n=1 Tax=Trichogramma kaykai TaxID=54128 RepID=A0ABD2WRD5_9HYME